MVLYNTKVFKHQKILTLLSISLISEKTCWQCLKPVFIQQCLCTVNLDQEKVIKFKETQVQKRNGSDNSDLVDDNMRKSYKQNKDNR